MRLDPWQVPLLVMAALALVIAIVWFVSSRGSPKAVGDSGHLLSKLRPYGRTSVLAVPSVLLAIVAFGIIGPPVVDRLTQAAALVTAIIGAIAAVKTFPREGAK